VRQFVFVCSAMLALTPNCYSVCFTARKQSECKSGTLGDYLPEIASDHDRYSSLDAKRTLALMNATHNGIPF
jgi:hypothetical protein